LDFATIITNGQIPGTPYQLGLLQIRYYVPRIIRAKSGNFLGESADKIDEKSKKDIDIDIIDNRYKDK